MKEPDHSIVSFQSKYCSCPWLRFPNVLQMSRDKRCRPQNDLLPSEAPAEARCPARARESGRGREAVPVVRWRRDGARSPAAGWGTEPGDGLGWQGRRKAEQSPVAARGKAGFLLGRKSPGRAFRVRFLGRGRCHRPTDRPTNRAAEGRPGERGAGASPAALAQAASGAWPDWQLEERLQDHSPGKQERFNVEANLMNNIRCLVRLVLLPMI